MKGSCLHTVGGQQRLAMNTTAEDSDPEDTLPALHCRVRQVALGREDWGGQDRGW